MESDKSDFIKNLERAEKEVSSWPDWKKECITSSDIVKGRLIK